MKRKCEYFLDAYVKCTDQQEYSPLYKKWCCIFAVAAALERKVYLQHGSRRFYPNFYIGLIGPPAARKGTAIDDMNLLLSSLTIKKFPDAGSIQFLAEKLGESMQSYMHNGNSVMHSSITAIAAELTSLISDKDMHTWLLHWFDCPQTWKYGVVHRETSDIVNIWLNILGAATPKGLAEADIYASESGMSSRFVLVASGPAPKRIALPMIDHDILELLISDIEQINILKGRFKMTTNAFKAYETYYINRPDEAPMGTRFEYYWGRRETHLLKLCMIVATMHDNELLITEDYFKKALILLREVESSMALAFSAGARPEAAFMHHIKTAIRKAYPNQISVAKLRRPNSLDLPETKFKDILLTFVSAGLIKMSQDSESGLWYAQALRRDI